jgi:hypothetical protein
MQRVILHHFFTVNTQKSCVQVPLNQCGEKMMQSSPPCVSEGQHLTTQTTFQTGSQGASQFDLPQSWCTREDQLLPVPR